MITTDPGVSDFLSDEDRSRIRAPIDTAGTFLNRTFTSQAYFEFEQPKVFGSNWAAVAFDAEVADVGDTIPIEAFGQQLFAVRSKDRSVRVFHNVCPYDGCPVVLERQAAASQLVAPYHGWVDAIDGELLVAPYWNGTAVGPVEALADRARLIEVRAEVRFGVVFIDLSGDAIPFDDFARPLSDELNDYDLDHLVIAKDRRGRPSIDRAMVPANWRTYCENALNVLHESFTHELHRTSQDHPRVTDDGEKRFRTHQGDGMFGFSYAVEDVDTYGPRILPHIGHDSEPPSRGHFFFLYPNLTGAAIGQSIFGVTIVVPVGPDRTCLVAATFTAQSAQHKLPSGLVHSQLNKGLAEAAREDGRVVEAIQRSRSSTAFDRQFFSPILG